MAVMCHSFILFTNFCLWKQFYCKNL